MGQGQLKENNKCVLCGSPIGEERLDAIPGAQHCISCAPKGKPSGFMIFGHKTAPTIVTIQPHDKEALRRAKRANRRAR